LLKTVSTTRRNNGSPSSIEKYLEAICGSNVDINSTNKTIKIYSERQERILGNFRKISGK
jgi:hypothetical protein